MKIVWYTISQLKGTHFLLFLILTEIHLSIPHHASGQGSSRCVASLSSTILFASIEAPSKPHLVIDTQ